jgi:hypothetical protein
MNSCEKKKIVIQKRYPNIVNLLNDFKNTQFKTSAFKIKSEDKVVDEVKSISKNETMTLLAPPEGVL